MSGLHIFHMQKIHFSESASSLPLLKDIFTLRTSRKRKHIVYLIEFGVYRNSAKCWDTCIFTLKQDMLILLS